MFCTICQKYRKSIRKAVWVTIPCQQFRKDKLIEHQRTLSHVDAVSAEASAVSAHHSGGVCAMMEERISIKRQAVIGAMKCLYWLAKEETAHHTKFSSLLELGKLLGCDYLSELEVSKRTNYTSHRIIDEFLVVLSDLVEQDILSKVAVSPAVGILCEKSTDVSNLKQLAVYVRFVLNGKAKTRFLKIIDICNGTAETIEQKLIDACQKYSIPMVNIFSIGSDGAAVLTGRKTGFAKRMKAHNSEMLSIHCGAHRVAVACSQAALQVPYVKKFDTYLTTLYYFFANSPVREAAFHHIQSLLTDPMLQLKKAVHTRWLSHDQAITVLRRTLS